MILFTGSENEVEPEVDTGEYENELGAAGGPDAGDTEIIENRVAGRRRQDPDDDDENTETTDELNASEEFKKELSEEFLQLLKRKLLEGPSNL